MKHKNNYWFIAFKLRNKENYTNVKLYENKLNYFNLHCHIIGIYTM